jgi:DNA-binding IclR family transcriptional regulator
MNRADRLHLLLGLFTVEKPLWTIEEAAASLDVSLSTAYRQFAALLRLGILEAIEGSRSYVLGPAIIALDRNIRLSDPLISMAKPAMRWLADQTPIPCTVMLCRLYRDRVMCIHQEEKPSAPGTVSYERGRLMPLWRGAPSKSIMAQLSSRQLEAIRARVPAREGLSDAAWEQFRHLLLDIRKHGYCMTRGEVDRGVVGLATPVRAPAAALSRASASPASAAPTSSRSRGSAR